MRWRPSEYEGFADQRLRPALDLIARVPLDQAAGVWDLGCGPGRATRLLARRWPAARVVGVDSSADMLDAARAAADGGAVEWRQADIAGWSPEGPADLIFSNAALHWLDDHPVLFRRLFATLAPGGVLAVQMPRNHAAPTHAAIAELAADPRWRDRLLPLVRPAPVAAPAAYWEILADRAASLDVWETEYLHALTGDAPVVRWVRGTVLAPLLDALDETERGAFLAEYGARMDAAYPRRGEVVLLPFRRLFVVAQRPGRRS